MTAIDPAGGGPIYTDAPAFERDGFLGYGGFWLRVAAALVDTIILVAAQLILAIVLGWPYEPPSGIAGLPHHGANGLIGLLYEVLFVSSYGGTPGKLLWGLKIVKPNGDRLSMLNALGRYFAKILSAIILLIGFIMVAFTKRKRGLHDILADTFVIKASKAI